MVIFLYVLIASGFIVSNLIAHRLGYHLAFRTLIKAQHSCTRCGFPAVVPDLPCLRCTADKQHEPPENQNLPPYPYRIIGTSVWIKELNIYGIIDDFNANDPTPFRIEYRTPSGFFMHSYFKRPDFLIPAFDKMPSDDLSKSAGC